MAANDQNNDAVFCPCCHHEFLNPSKLGDHLRNHRDIPTSCKPCTDQHYDALRRNNLGECGNCHKWYVLKKNGEGFSRHNRCTVIPDAPPAARDSDSDSTNSLVQSQTGGGNFLDSVLSFMNAYISWEDLSFCPYGTMTEVKPVHKEWNAAFAPVLELIQRGEINLSFKLLLFTMRCCSQPTKRDLGLNKESQRKRIKTLVRRFLEGDFTKLWEEQAKLTFVFDEEPLLGDSDKDLGEEDRIRRARAHVKAGELSRCASTLKSTARADPTRHDVQAALRHLHPGPNPEDPFPRLPADLDSNDERYKFSIKTVQVPVGNGQFDERCSLIEGLRGLRKRITQSMTGMRNEHFISLDPEITKALAGWTLNNKFTDEAKDILIAGKGLGLFKSPNPPSPVPENGIRPIVRGEVLRSIADRVKVVQENPSLKPEFLKAMQFGVGVKGGVEYAYHSSRLHLLSMLEADEGDIQRDDAADPGMDQLDCANAFGMCSRSSAFKWLIENRPRLLRSFVFCYGTPAKICFLWGGVEAFSLLSHHGSQQGSVDGGHVFVFSTMQFATQVLLVAPNAHLCWVMDDLTVTGTQEDRAAVADFLIEEGPQYGLFQSTKDGANNSYASSISEEHLARGFKHCPRGLHRLLGAPIGDDDFIREAVVSEVDKLTQSVRHLHKIGDFHREGVLLRFCYCASINHLCRLLPPHAMLEGIELFEQRMKAQLARLAVVEDLQQLDDAFEIAKQPVRNLGIGLGDVKLTAPASFAASMGAVARLSEEINLPYSTHILQVIQRDPHSKGVFSDLSTSTPDTPNPICPALVDVTKTPSQKEVSEPLYTAKSKSIIDDMRPRFNHRQPGDAALRTLNVKKTLFFISQSQFGSGKEYDTIPIHKQDHLDSFTYSHNLRLRLGLETRYNIITDKGTSHANARHNALRRIMKGMYEKLGEKPMEEPEGLLKAQVNILRRPADIGIIPAVHQTEKLLALDVSVVSPVSCTFIKAYGPNSDPKPLQAASSKEDSKLKENKAWVAKETSDPIYEKVPVVFESTGAFGESAHDWFKMMMLLFKRKFPEGIRLSSPMGLEMHWGATSFQAYYHQKFALSLAKSRGSSFWHSQVNPIGP